MVATGPGGAGGGGATYLNGHCSEQNAAPPDQSQQLEHQAARLIVWTRGNGGPRDGRGRWSSMEGKGDRRSQCLRGAPVECHGSLTGGTRDSSNAVSIQPPSNLTERPANANAPCSPCTSSSKHPTFPHTNRSNTRPRTPRTLSHSMCGCGWRVLSPCLWQSWCQAVPRHLGTTRLPPPRASLDLQPSLRPHRSPGQQTHDNGSEDGADGQASRTCACTMKQRAAHRPELSHAP